MDKNTSITKVKFVTYVKFENKKLCRSYKTGHFIGNMTDYILPYEMVFAILGAEDFDCKAGDMAACF